MAASFNCKQVRESLPILNYSDGITIKSRRWQKPKPVRKRRHSNGTAGVAGEQRQDANPWVPRTAQENTCSRTPGHHLAPSGGLRLPSREKERLAWTQRVSGSRVVVLAYRMARSTKTALSTSCTRKGWFTFDRHATEKIPFCGMVKYSNSARIMGLFTNKIWDTLWLCHNRAIENGTCLVMLSSCTHWNYKWFIQTKVMYVVHHPSLPIIDSGKSPIVRQAFTGGIPWWTRRLFVQVDGEIGHALVEIGSWAVIVSVSESNGMRSYT